MNDELNIGHFIVMAASLILSGALGLVGWVLRSAITSGVDVLREMMRRLAKCETADAVHVQRFEEHGRRLDNHEERIERLEVPS